MQLEKTGNYLDILKVKVKDDYVSIEYKEKEDISSKKVKISYQTFEDNFIKEGEISKNDFLEILKNDKKNEIKKYISNLIIKKPYCKNDLTLKALEKFKKDKVLVHIVVKELESVKIIDDREYVLTYLEYFNNAFYGKYYITNFFNEKEIKESIIEEIKFDDEQEFEKAKKYFELIKNKYVSSNLAKQKRKISETMLKRGFDFETINEVLKSLNINRDVELKKLTKEYIKVKEKFSKENNFKKEDIISFLVNSGYEFKDVEEIISKDEKGELTND